MTTITRGQALDEIAAIRATLTHSDSEAGALICIIRGLHDGHSLEETRDHARRLLLSDYRAEQKIKNIVAAVED